jgi:hypothetical protein
MELAQISVLAIILDLKILKFNNKLGLIGVVLLHDEKSSSIENLFKHLNMQIDLVMLHAKLKFAYAQCEN